MSRQEILNSNDPNIAIAAAGRESLAIETLRALRLSAAAFELHEFLRENDIRINRNGAGLLSFLRRILEEDPAGWVEMKHSFLQALHFAGGKVAVKSDRGRMTAVLAEFGTDLEFEAFYQDLKEAPAAPHADGDQRHDFQQAQAVGPGSGTCQREKMPVP